VSRVLRDNKSVREHGVYTYTIELPSMIHNVTKPAILCPSTSVTSDDVASSLLPCQYSVTMPLTIRAEY